ncbi:polymorphic toxin type 28 domain-containing protein [Streptomyces sp. NBC_01571]|uniref:polymorphic toxin type 28 domain-containing protein n=1 Tax=Streptomyces sp. NBC_01571 TaxID=2975883 RepID=UPI00224EC570|nr:polymorphic toxin type 28 domain-containing protein [Streptomyces sp. NBC_01571]MCX4578069.1 polymorphic toxin type 28 domain-containing protein [Streptomyces sp. NBC_01571]
MSIEDKAKDILLKMGLWWPDANSGTLRSAATAWRTFAESVDDVRGPTNSTARSLIHHNKGESIEAFDKFWSQYAKGKDAGWLGDLADSARAMAKFLDKFADAIDDAIHKLWEHIAIDAAVIAGGVAVAFLTAGLASGAAAAAADAVIELGATLGVAVSTTIAEIAAETVITAAFAGVENVTIDAAVAQPLKMAAGLQQGFSLDEVNQAAQDGMIFGGALGAGSGVLRAGVSPSLSKAELLMRPPSLRPDLVELGPAARNGERIPCVGEPIDVASGAMLMMATDLTLPATLPLVFQRTHLSSYRGGVCFGPTWISTLDECVQIDGEGVVFAAADGMRLVYGVPEPGVPTLPVTGPRWPLEWDGKPDGVMTVTDPDAGVSRTFTTPFPSGSFGTFHLPVDAWSDRNGMRIDVERTTSGVPLGLRHSGGYYVAVDTDGPRITALRLLDQDPDAYTSDSMREGGTVVMRYGYDVAGNLSEVINSSGQPLTFAYDDAGRMTKWTDRNGTWFSYVYDERGRVTRTEGIDGILSGTLAYNDAASTTTYTDSLGHTSVHRYNAEGLVVEATDQLGNMTRTEWDEHGAKPLTVTDPLGRTTRYTYDDAEHLTRVTLPDDAAVQASYNDLGLPTEVVEPGGARWLHAYDEHGNLLTTTDPLGAETHHSYDISGHLVAITDALGHTRTMSVNPAGLPLSLTDELGRTTIVHRDSFGRIAEIIDPLGHSTRLSWSIEGKPQRIQHPDETQELWSWDGEGNLLSHTNQAGEVVRHAHGVFDVPAIRTDPDDATYCFTHDTELRLTRVTNPQGLTWSYTYDQAGRLTAETDFNGRTLAYDHDASGALRSRTNGAGETLRFTRDVRGRVTEQVDHAGRATTYTYGLDGSLIRAVSSDAVLAVAYDDLGQVLTESVNDHTVAYAYDELGRRTRRDTPSGLSTHWAYDAASQPIELRTAHGNLRFAYDAAGREIERRIGADLILAQTWDKTDRLTLQTLAAPGSSESYRFLQHRSYTYRADGYLTEIRELTTGTRKFDLDSMGRVSRIRAYGWSETYAYDTAGNLTRATAPDSEESEERVFEGTLIRRAGRTRYEYDAQGRMVRKIRKLLNGRSLTWSYTWNAQDRLTRLTTPTSEQWHYVYDPRGRRIAKYRVADDGSETERTDFVWDDARLCEQLASGGRATSWDYAPGTHVPLTQITHQRRVSGTSFLAQIAHDNGEGHLTPQFHAVITDTAGSPTELVTTDGQVPWEQRTTLWGNPLSAPTGSDSAVDCPLRFAGQYFDSETGSHYSYFRYYDPDTARYLSLDPLGLTPAPNPSTYVHNPLTWGDPLGLNPCELGLSTGAQRALEKLENIKKDPVGEINSQPNHNHYNAARREANGEVVARKADGTPFDHIADLKQARNGLDKIRRVLDTEIQNPPDTLTSRGIDVLVSKHKETVRLLDRLNGFLASIGHR